MEKYGIHLLSLSLKEHGVPNFTLKNRLQSEVYDMEFHVTPMQEFIRGDFIVQYGDKEIIESFVGFGDDWPEEVQAVLEAFFAADLHVFLNALNESNDDEVDAETWRINGTDYTAFIGRNLMRTMGEDMELMDEMPFFEELEKTIKAMPLERDLHWIRFFVGSVPGDGRTIELLVDNEPYETGQDAMRTFPWIDKDYYFSFRVFLMLVPENYERPSPRKLVKPSLFARLKDRFLP